jgi:hypothetical protein
MPGPDHDPAAARFWTLQVLRIAGIIVTLLGAAGAADRMAMPDELSALLLAAGVGIFFGLPVALARKWKAGK